MPSRRKVQKEELRLAALERGWGLVNSYGTGEDDDDEVTTPDLAIDVTSPDLEVEIVDQGKHLSDSTPEAEGTPEAVQASVDEQLEPTDVLESNELDSTESAEVAGEMESDRVTDPADPIRDIGSHPTSPGRDAVGLDRTLAAHQQEVVDWLRYAMSSWLEYFFVLDDGTPEERLDKAGEELARAARRLNNVAYLISDLSDTRMAVDQALRAYTSSVEMWATGVDMLSRATLARRGRFAREGFRILEEGSSSIRPLIDSDASGPDSADLAGPLDLLDTTNPTKRVPKKEVQAAKGPWRRALISSGSPLRALIDEGAEANSANEAQKGD